MPCAGILLPARAGLYNRLRLRIRDKNFARCSDRLAGRVSGFSGMTQNELAGLLGEQLSISKASANRLIRAFAPVFIEALSRGEKVKLPGLGTFSTYTRAARSGFDLRNRGVVHIPSRRSVRFSPWHELRAALLDSVPAEPQPATRRRTPLSGNASGRQPAPTRAQPSARQSNPNARWRTLVNSDEVHRLLGDLDLDYDL